MVEQPQFDEMDFNPRSHEESDGARGLIPQYFDKISIHALTKRATWWCVFQSFCSQDFNPRSHEESDDIGKYLGLVDWEFQSTLSRRERLEYTDSNNELSDFNPRSHEESDPLAAV